MKIVFCRGGFAGAVSGADQTLVNYVLRLRDAGHEPSLMFVYPHSGANQYFAQLREAGVPMSCLTRHPLYAALRAARRLILRLPHALPGEARRRWERWQEPIRRTALYLLRYHRPDLAHVLEPWGETPALIRAAHAAGVPVIYHDFGTPGAIPDRDEDYDQLTEAIPLCSEVAALSPMLARLCRERFRYPGAASALPLITEEGGAAGDLRRRDADGVTFGFAARLEPLKGPALLLEAFALLHRVCPRARLRVAGAGPLRQELSARAESLSIAHLCDFVGAYAGKQEMSAFMRSLDVFVLPSFTEGTPNSIIEAMAHGLPVIASSVGGIPDMISPQSGVLVPAGEVAALAEAMARLAADAGLRDRMGREARRQYETLFSPDAVMPVLLETYRRVLRKSRAGGAEATPDGGLPVHPWARVIC